MKPLRIGCGAGFWGDSAEGPRQLVRSGEIDVLVLDYLAEITMSLLARARARDPAAGYATDLPGVLAALAEDLKARGIRVVTNAGGVNPQACKAALEEKLAAQGIALKIAIVTGDDLLPRTAEFAHLREMFSDEALPASPWSFNAYFGAFPIAEALAGGADIVITGRCVDSALALGPLIHAFGWKPTDYDRLSAGSLAGHVIECGVQATGGLATDWEAVVADWDHMGFPIAICESDGSFVLTKPTGTGGRVAPETVAEQIVYEVGDPAAYLLPDVSCDWRDLRVEAAGPDRVRVSGARGCAPSAYYKCSVTAQEGFRCATTMMVGGLDAVRKAEAVGGAVLARTRRMFAAQNLGDYLRTHIEVLGAEFNWGAHARRSDTREVILKIAVQHADKRALEIFSRECIPAATAMAQGLTGFAGGRPTPSPLVRLWSCLVPKAAVPIQIDARPWSPPPIEVADDQLVKAVPLVIEPLPTGPVRRVRLIDLAYGRSGDKGDAANIGVLARRPEFVPVLREQLTAASVKDWFAHFVTGSVERYEWPGLQGFNFLMQGALGGGGIASLRHDPQGKMFAQILMDFPLDVPEALFESRA